MKKRLMIFLLSICVFLSVSVVNAQIIDPLWTPLPPYNLLWPLWSPLLSPPDPVTGQPVPLVTELTSTTILPVQPALILNPRSSYNPFGLLPDWVFSLGGTNWCGQYGLFNLLIPFPPQAPPYYPQTSYPISIGPDDLYYGWDPVSETYIWNTDPIWIQEAYPFVINQYLSRIYALYYTDPALWLGASTWFPPYTVYTDPSVAAQYFPWLF